uniref:Uncharacterized protein n=1 Tax=Physcomitrium patens TaxID=3218 RepID=A0A2K1JPX5_PHYPA|nr:hypothetical protein PHYPA_015975 [Physcomitrium patens]
MFPATSVILETYVNPQNFDCFTHIKRVITVTLRLLPTKPVLAFPSNRIQRLCS